MKGKSIYLAAEAYKS